MKKIIVTMLVALSIFATAEARHERKAEPKNSSTEKTVEKDAAKSDQESVNDDGKIVIADKVSFSKDGVIVKKEDGTSVKVKMGDLGRIISKHLDDTVINADGINVDSKGDENEGLEVGSAEYNIVQNGMMLADRITTSFAVAIVFIVFFSLLFYYLHRRRKYKTVDRAIQAGYPLPDEFFGKRSQQIPQQPTTVYVTQVTPPAADPNASQGTQPASGMMPGYGQSSNPLNNITDWTPFKSGIKTTAWGIGLLLFFWIVGAEPIAALMLIVVFIGLGKLFTTYQEQQSLKNYWQQQQWAQPTSQQEQPQQPQSQQWQQPEHSNQVPPMPETPPEFNAMHNLQSSQL